MPPLPALSRALTRFVAAGPFPPFPLPSFAGGGLLSEELKPRAGLPPLLVNLADRPAERLHYLGVSFGLTQQLYSFWRRSAFRPVYLRQTPSDVTGGCHWPTLRPRLPGHKGGNVCC